MVGAAYAVQTALNGGSELLISVLRAAHSQFHSGFHWARRLGRPEAFSLETHLTNDRGPRPRFSLSCHFNVSPMAPSFGEVRLASRTHHD
jgi:hypothetical protein